MELLELEAKKNIKDICSRCGFNMLGNTADIYIDCMGGNCKHLAKAMRDLKPYYDAKMKILQYDKDHPEGPEIKLANRKRESRLTDSPTMPLVPIKEHLENLEKMTSEEIVAYHAKGREKVHRIRDFPLMEAEYAMYISEARDKGDEPQTFRKWVEEQEGEGYS